ncbi:unnamed protein product [Dibothriocephalus latus]|uniref:Uncharacterized protein n=1 Tax=Dibothriocephalus latus TaxID=60516 RepID=A0A3P7N523_DIBLA|nr:unnamed protein product [Dibothriocephalus latus]
MNASKVSNAPVCDYWWIQNYSLLYVDNLCEAPTEFALLGTVSFCLTLLNIVLIIITGYSVNWVGCSNQSPPCFSPLSQL